MSVTVKKKKKIKFIETGWLNVSRALKVKLVVLQKVYKLYLMDILGASTVYDDSI